MGAGQVVRVLQVMRFDLQFYNSESDNPGSVLSVCSKGEPSVFGRSKRLKDVCRLQESIPPLKVFKALPGSRGFGVDHIFFTLA